MLNENTSDSKVRGANMGPTSALSAPDRPHVGPINLAIRDISQYQHPLKLLNQYVHRLVCLVFTSLFTSYKRIDYVYIRLKNNFI